MPFDILDENPVAPSSGSIELVGDTPVAPPQKPQSFEILSPIPTPPNAHAIYRAMEERPDYRPSSEDAKTLFDYEKKQTNLSKLTRLAEAVPGAVEAAAKPFLQAPGDIAANISNPGRIVNSAIGEGSLRGSATLGNLGRMAVRKAYDAARDFGESDAQKLEHFHQRILDNLKWSRALATGADGQGNLSLLQFRPDGSIGPIPGAKNIPESEKPIQSISDVAANFFPPMPPVAAGAKDIITPAARALTRGAARVLPEAVAEAASKAASKLNPLPKVPGALEKAGTVLKAVGSAPEKLTTAVLEGAVPEAARPILDKFSHLTGTGAAIAGLAGHGGPLGTLFAVLKSIEGTGWSLEKAGQFFKELSQTSGDSQIPRLLQLANKADVPEWVQGLAKGMDRAGVGTATQSAGDLAKGAAHGAVVGGVIGGATAENPEEAGKQIGAGAMLGTAGKAAAKLSGSVGRERAIQQRLGDLSRFFVHLKEQGVPDATILKIQTGPALMASALQAATAKGIFHNAINFKFLEAKDYEPIASQGGFSGTAAFHDPISNTVVVNVDAKRNALTHELGHAALKAAGADSEARLAIDSIFTPEQITVMGREYAQRLTDNELRVQGIDPSSLLPENYRNTINHTIQTLTDAHKGDAWIYNEIYADAAYGGLLGKDLKRDVIDTGSLRQRAQGKLLEALGASPEPGETGIRKQGVFTDPEVYTNPALRKLVYEHLRDLYRNGASAKIPKESKEGLPKGTPVPPDLMGKHPSVPVFPNPSTGRLENDFAVVDPKSGKVTLRTPREVRQIERERQREVNEEVKQIEKQPVQPAPNPSAPPPTTNLGPRKNAAGVVEIVGTKIKGFLDKLTRFGDEAKKNAGLAEGAMDSGNVLDTWYQAAGTSAGSSWKGDVRRRLANVAASKVKLAPFLFKVSKEGNVLIVGLSLNAADRKMARWADKEVSPLQTLWGGDQEAFKNDLMVYLKNHAEGRPGAETIGDKKRDALNVFVLGDHRTFAAANPLRDALHGVEKQGVIRSLRLDRMMNAEMAKDKGWFPEHEKKVHNLSPDIVPSNDDLTVGAVSPNIDENLKFDEAKRRLNSGTQGAFRAAWDELDKSLGIEAKLDHAVGDWADGAENSVFFASNQKGLSQETVRYVLAKMGLQADQKGVAHFAPDRQGKDGLYLFELATTDLDEVRQTLDKAGVKFRTIVPQGKGLRVAIIDIGGTLAENNAVQKVADHYGTDIQFRRGTADFIEGRNRADARRVYRKLIREYETKKGPDHRIGRPADGGDLQSPGATRDASAAP